jgi:hypothetical protein
VKQFPVLLALVVMLAIMALLVGATEVVVKFWGGALRLPMYCGGMAGLVLGVVAIPFLLQLKAMAGVKDASGAFWKWWGAGLLLRMVILLGMALGLMSWFRQQSTAALLSLLAVYLIGMFVEAAWLASVFIQSDTKK